MKKISLKIKVLFTTLAVGFLTVMITVAITPWGDFQTDHYSSRLDSRFYYAGNIERRNAEYERIVYQRLRPEKAESDGASGSTNNASNNGASNDDVIEAIKSQQNTASVIESLQSVNSDAMAGIMIAEADGSPYTRSDYGSGWDVSELKCNIRATLLARVSTVAVQTASNGCTVTYGSWVDPYSGRVLTGNPYQGDGTENDLDIDHVIPLKYVNSHGGYAWSVAAKVAYGKSVTAMNNGVYVAVSASENRKKSDSGPADYYPSNPNYYCEYSRKWRDVARIYAIKLSQRDYDKVKGVLAECNIN